eukprot:1373560-Rhodomonas_salina.5
MRGVEMGNFVSVGNWSATAFASSSLYPPLISISPPSSFPLLLQARARWRCARSSFVATGVRRCRRPRLRMLPRLHFLPTTTSLGWHRRSLPFPPPSPTFPSPLLLTSPSERSKRPCAGSCSAPSLLSGSGLQPPAVLDAAARSRCCPGSLGWHRDRRRRSPPPPVLVFKFPPPRHGQPDGLVLAAAPPLRPPPVSYVVPPVATGRARPRAPARLTSLSPSSAPCLSSVVARVVVTVFAAGRCSSVGPRRAP